MQSAHSKYLELIGGLKILKSSSAYWKGDEKNASMREFME